MGCLTAAVLLLGILTPSSQLHGALRIPGLPSRSLVSASLSLPTSVLLALEDHCLQTLAIHKAMGRELILWLIDCLTDRRYLSLKLRKKNARAIKLIDMLVSNLGN